MTKLYVRTEIFAKNAARKLFKRLSSNEGFGTVEWILLVVVIAGVVIALKPSITSTFTKIAGLWDTELVNKFNGAK